MADGATGDLVPLTIKVTTPGNRDDLEARMAHRDAQGLPEAVQHKTCVIVGSGPSARHSALWERLEAFPETITVACNGALSLFTEHGLAPTYWACCDPQEGEVLRFLAEPLPLSTTYLVATKCPPALFDRLDGFDVRVWRLDDMAPTPGALHVTCAVSITLVAMNLGRFMGFTRFETYGWDCCYLDGEHHASRQPEPEGKLPFEIQDAATGDVMHTFEVCGSWAAELQDAAIQAHNYAAMGYELIVHGPGAVGTFLRAKKLIN